MATIMSAKRPRALTSGNGNSTAHYGRSKRPRHSTPDFNANSPDEKRSITPSNSESADDDREVAQEQEQMIWTTQQVQRDFQTGNQQNIATESGIIEEIQCINFMCHEHLTVTLGPLINFIIGHNGSGKSAVLTALTICLGGKATATNRAQNLKSLIKEGKEHSSVQVRIKNRGPLAYKHALYHDSIIVERHFSRSGTSGFKLKDKNGKIVSQKKAELEDILDAFSMQIDNPMNVLTQDMARQFLNHSTPKEKYKFFLQGTQLENLNRDYQQIEQSLEIMNSKADVKKGDLAVLRKKMEELAAKARRAENLERMRAQEKTVAHQAMWARVEEEEAKLAEVNAELENVDTVIQKRKDAVEEASVAFERSDSAHEAAKESVYTFKLELEPARDGVQDVKGKFDEIKQKLMKLKADERHAGSDVTAKNRDKDKIEKDIEELRRRQTEADDGLHAQKVRQLEEAKAHLETVKEAYTQHGTELVHIDNDLKAALDKKRHIDGSVRQIREQSQQIRRQIQNLQEGQRKWIEAYDRPGELERLLRAIETERTFRTQPVGPMGRYVKLLKSDWGSILEKQFGSSLNAFVVTCKQDQTILARLMKRCQWSSPIYIGTEAAIDTSQHEPDPSLLTWMRALKIENDLVRNQLIINQQIDQTVLKESRTEGSQFMHNRGPLTRNVKMCFTFQDGNNSKGRLFNYTASGGINDSPIDEYQRTWRMQADKEDQVRLEQTRLAAAERNLRDAETAANNHQEHINQCKAREQDHNKRKKELQLSFLKAQDIVDKLDGELIDATPDAAAIELLQESLIAAKKDLETVGGVYEDIHVQLARRNAESKECFDDLTIAKNKLDDVEHKLNKAQASVRALQGTREDDLKQKNKAIEQLGKAKENRKLWEEQQQETQQSIEQLIIEARQTCPERIELPDGKSPEELGNLLQRLTNTRRQAERELGGSQEELLRAANEAKKVHQEANREFQDIEGVKSHLINTLNHRRHRWQQFRSGISVRARVTFTYLLSERKFRGNLSIDHKKSLLDIHVQPDITEKSGDGRQTKTLSGGEKSYSTVCLLLSLWDAMGSPIRCLDEFDVFMDSVNRDRSMNMIIQAARRSIGRQFIFITPQAMNSVNQDSDVKIIRMSDPERGQTALSFRQG